MSIESVQELLSFIKKEESHIDLGRLDKVNETSVSCGDPIIHSSAEWRLVGGVVYLFVNGPWKTI